MPDIKSLKDLPISDMNDWEVFQNDTEAKDNSVKEIWDLHNFLSQEPLAFGYVPKTSLSGLYVKFIGDFICNLTHVQRTGLPTILGVWLGDIHGRGVIATNFGYLGWVNPEDIEFINMVENSEISH